MKPRIRLIPHQASIGAMLLVLFATSFAVRQAAALEFETVQLAGMQMQLPRDWQRQMDDYSLILVQSPEQERSPVLALFAQAIEPGVEVTAGALADSVLEQLDLPNHGIRPRLIEQRPQGAALYRLHLLETDDGFGYMASYSFTDPASGALVHMFFSAPESGFVELGGPMLPLVAFGGLDPRLLQRARDDAATSFDPAGCSPANVAACGAIEGLGASAAPYIDACGNAWNQALTEAQKAAAEANCLQSIEIASQISRMSHETSMKILYNADSGWCYRGEYGCD